MKPSLLLCDDHVLLSEAVATTLARRGFADIELAASPDQALTLLRRKHRDVVVMDLAFPDGDGLAAAREIHVQHPDTQVVLLSAFADPGIVAAGFDVGIAGFCRKDMGIAGIARAIEQVHTGEVFVDAALLRRTVKEKAREESAHLARYLTRRELEVLARLTAGETTDKIAEVMGVTRSTARTHVQNVLTKLGVHSRLEAVVVAAKAGIRLPAL
ncbi:MAG: response regulator [Frankiaceae bacterium]